MEAAGSYEAAARREKMFADRKWVVSVGKTLLKLRLFSIFLPGEICRNKERGGFGLFGLIVLKISEMR